MPYAAAPASHRARILADWHGAQPMVQMALSAMKARFFQVPADQWKPVFEKQVAWQLQSGHDEWWLWADCTSWARKRHEARLIEQSNCAGARGRQGDIRFFAIFPSFRIERRPDAHLPAGERIIALMFRLGMYRGRADSNPIDSRAHRELTDNRPEPKNFDARKSPARYDDG